MADPPATDEVTSRELTYEHFSAWYDDHRSSVLEPALAVGQRRLDAVLADLLSDRDLARIRPTSGRVKSKQRTWRKIRSERYLERVRSVADIPKVIDDLVGLRITCTNVRDIEVVQGALETLPRRGRGPLRIDASSERDYLRQPKESGYRGYHVNLVAQVPSGGRARAVTCELQVRTLLQDSWGELTHEDTYHVDSSLPPLVEVLSRRMADLLATIDDIAEDLRAELDRIDDAAVADDHTGGSGVVVEDHPGESAEAASRLVDRWRASDRPVDLASLAWALQREFGTEVSQGWFGHRTFKAFLLHAIPAAEISTAGQPYLLPPPAPSAPPSAPAPAPALGADGPDVEKSDIPAAARQLKRIDRSFPLLPTAQWHRVFTGLAVAWAKLGPRRPTAAFVTQLTRSARDRAEAGGVPVSRRHLDHVARAVVLTEAASGPLDAQQIAASFTELTIRRMIDLRIVSDGLEPAAEEVRSWLDARP